MTEVAKDLVLSVAKPKSPILTHPVVPVMKMLSHFKSRWMMGGVLECKNCSPFNICLDQDLITFVLTFFNFRTYLMLVQNENWLINIIIIIIFRHDDNKSKMTYALSVPDDMSSVIKTRYFLLGI